MKTILSTAMLAAALAFQTPALEAQERRPHLPAQGSGWLVQNRAELGLSDAQVARLHEIAQQLEERNRPLIAELRDAGVPMGPRRREMTAEEQRELHAMLREHRPTLLQLRQNAQAAMQEARAVLTREQMQRARELMRDREERDGRRERGRSPHRGSGR